MNKILDFLKRHKVLTILWIISIIVVISEFDYYPQFVIYDIVLVTIVFIITARHIDNKKVFKSYIECPNCKNKIYDNSNFCGKCGYMINNVNNPNSLPRKRDKNNIKSTILIGIGAFIIYGFIGIILLWGLFAGLLVSLFGKKGGFINETENAIVLIAEDPLCIGIIILALVLIIIGVILKRKNSK